MASVTNKTREETMAEDREDDKRNRPRPDPDHTGDRSGRQGGFFSVYKKGHGYWTRMGTAAGAALLGLFTANFLWQYVPVWIGESASQDTARNIALGVAAGFLVLYALFAWWVMNRPTNADFLIATDGEMKRVNWTSRKELIGSTKVVVIFMFLTAAFLFATDIVFGYFFYFIKVLQTKPF